MKNKPTINNGDKNELFSRTEHMLVLSAEDGEVFAQELLKGSSPSAPLMKAKTARQLQPITDR